MTMLTRETDEGDREVKRDGQYIDMSKAKSLHIDPRLRSRISITTALGQIDKQTTGRLTLSAYGECECESNTGGNSYVAMSTATEEEYTTCTEAGLVLKAISATLMDQGTGVRKFEAVVVSQILPNGDPGEMKTAIALNFPAGQNTIELNDACFKGIGGYCGERCLEAAAHQIITVTAVADANAVGITEAFNESPADRVFQVEMVIRKLKNARIWLRFLVTKSCY